MQPRIVAVPIEARGSAEQGQHVVPRALMQIVEVVAISGNEVTIGPPVHYPHLASLDPEAFFWEGGNLQHAGIEDLAIDAQFTDAPISMTFCTNCWVKGVQIEHVGRGAVQTHYRHLGLG